MARSLSSIIPLIRFLNSRVNLSLDLDKVGRYLSCTKDCLLEDIKFLKDNGFSILEKDNKIILLSKIDLLDKDVIYKEVKGRGRVEVIDVIGSTNTELLQRSSNLACGDCLLTEIQTAGRGQQDKVWYSGVAHQLCLSMGWSFPSLEKIQGLSIAVGVEIAKELSKRGFDVKVKWPNDLYLNSLKLGGILVETLSYKDKIVVVIGVGLNVHLSKFSGFSKKIAFLEEVKYLSRNESAILVLNALKQACNNIQEVGFTLYPKMLEQYDFLFGKKLDILTPHGLVSGISKGVSDKGELLIENPQGFIKISSGHII